MAGRSYTAPPSKSPPFGLQRSRSGASRLGHSTSALDSPLTSSTVNGISTGATALRRAVSAARSRSTTNSRADPTTPPPPPPLQRRPQQRDSKENRDTTAASGCRQQKPAGGPLRAAEAAATTKQRKPRSGGFSNPGAPASPAAAPSAWALSPGRSSPSPAPETPENGVDRVKKKPGIRGVLGFFRQKKAPSPRDQATAHQLRVLHCRHLQWRFVNARAEVAAGANKANSEKKLFNVWVRLRQLRKVVAVKRALVQRERHQTKLAAVVGPQLRLLQDWNECAGGKSVEAMAKCGELLQAACTAVPLVEGARADVEALRASISTAMGIMEGMESTIARVHPKCLSDASSLLDELVKTLKLEREGLEELAEVAGRAASLQMQEMSLRAHLVQATGVQG